MYGLGADSAVLPPAPVFTFSDADLPDPVPMPGVTKLSDITVKGRGDWMLPIAIGIIAAWFIFYRGGSRKDW